MMDERPDDKAPPGAVDTDAPLGECPALDEDSSPLGTAEWHWDNEGKFSLGRLLDDTAVRFSRLRSRSTAVAFGALLLLFLSLAFFSDFDLWPSAIKTDIEADTETEAAVEDVASDANQEATPSDDTPVPIPDIAQLQALRVADALVLLGEGWQQADSEQIELDEGEYTELYEIAVLQFAGPGFTAGADAPALYAGLAENGNIRTVEFVASMDRLGYPQMDFADLVNDGELLRETLASAGITPTDHELSAPPAEMTVLRESPEDEDSAIIGDSWMFVGKHADSPTGGWTLTLTYEGANGTDASEAKPPLRTLSVKVY
jgi:hypothetical protein